LPQPTSNEAVTTAIGKPPRSRKSASAFDFPAGSAAWAAGRLLCDGIVEPKETRAVLSRAIQVQFLLLYS
jgi:acetyl-CoA carboxylase carboxyltransferase component